MLISELLAPKMGDRMGNSKIILGIAFGLLVLSIGSFSTMDAYAALDSKGTEFLIAFLDNVLFNTLQLQMTSDVSTQATINWPAINPTFTTTVAVNPGQITIVDIPQSAEIWVNNAPDDNLVKVTSPEEITVYTVNRAPATSDAALALPTDTFSFKYVTMSYSGGSQFVVAAKFDNTIVTIQKVGLAPFDVTLNKDQGWSTRGGDFSGSIITADKPIGITNGNACVAIPPSVGFCDHIYEHGIPVQGWGERVLITDIPQRPSGTIFRIFASEDNTQVSLDGVNLVILNETEFHETRLVGGHIITADKPIFVVQYITGIDDPGATNGDPAMANIIPTEQYLNSYTFSTVGGNQFNQHFVTITAANSDISTIQFDGAPIGAGNFTPIGSSGFSSAIINNISQGTHTTSSTNGHGILVGGYNSFDSYLYPGGAAFEFINPQPEDDRDGDGVPDLLDECPDEFAETLNGCPGVLYGSDNQGNIFVINHFTGQGTLVGTFSETDTFSTDIECNGLECYAQARNGFFFMEQFDLATATLSGSPFFNGESFTGLEYVGDTLYGTSLEFPRSPSLLSTIDPVGETVTPIGLTGVGPITGLAWDEVNEIMFGVGTDPFETGPTHLYTIDLDTGNATQIGTPEIHLGSLQFGPDGKLYAGATGGGPGGGGDRGNLYVISTNPGNATLVGPTGFDGVTGLTLGPIISEPDPGPGPCPGRRFERRANPLRSKKRSGRTPLWTHCGGVFFYHH